MSTLTPTAVTFDLWNTLLVSDPGGVEVRRDAWQQVVDERELDISGTLLDEVLEAFPSRFESEWRAGRQFGAPEAMAEAFIAFSGLISADDERALADAFDVASTRLVVDVVAGAPEVVSLLAGHGIGVAIVSDTSLTGGIHLRGYLDFHGILDHVDHASFSDEVGVYKPHPSIFHDALAGLGVDDPTGVVHVGDLKRTDVAGARALGMTTVRFRGAHDDDEHGDEADHVIDRLVDLPAVLGLA